MLQGMFGSNRGGIDNILGGYFIDDGSGGGESEEITEEK